MPRHTKKPAKHKRKLANKSIETTIDKYQSLKYYCLSCNFSSAMRKAIRKHVMEEHMHTHGRDATGDIKKYISDRYEMR